MKYSTYYVTPCGRVYNGKTKKFLKPIISNRGYLRVAIKGKMKAIHRLVADKYLPNPLKKSCVDHIDGNRLNNNIDNLRWCTYEENNKNPITLERMAATKRKICICVETGKVYNSTKEAAKDLNVAPSVVRASIYHNYKIRHQWRFIYA